MGGGRWGKKPWVIANSLIYVSGRRSEYIAQYEE